MSKIIVLVGLPGSGKSTYAKKYCSEHSNTVHMSSDNLRLELYGDENVQTDNNKVFRLMHQRTIQYLKDGVDVVYDATNVSRKNRRAILDAVPEDVVKCIHIIWCPFYKCVTNDQSRLRTVGYGVIKKFLYRWESPYYDENVDEIKLIYSPTKDTTTAGRRDLAIKSLLIPHDNPHHTTSTIYDHCVVAEAYGILHTYDQSLIRALRWHDVGKPFTKFWKTDELGIAVGPAHFYNHDNVGGYFVYGLLAEDEDPIYVSWLVCNHMQPFYNSKYWKNLPPHMKKAIDLIHEADVSAH